MVDALGPDLSGYRRIQRRSAFRLLEQLRLKSRDRVLEVGCGVGHFTYALHKTTLGRVVGVDASADHIRKAMELYPDLSFRQLSAETLDYRESFQAVFCSSSIHRWENPAPGVIRMREALQTGGRLAVESPATPRAYPGWPELASTAWFRLEDELAYEDWFEQLGFATEVLKLDFEEDELPWNQALGFYAADQGSLAGKERAEFASGNGPVRLQGFRLYYVGTKI